MVSVECLCPPTPAGETRHPDGDTIELHERLDFAAGRTARNIVGLGKEGGDSTAEILTALTEWYMFAGIRTWTVVDAKGKAVEPNRATIRLYLIDREDVTAADLVGDAADELYSDAVLLPLVARGSTSSSATPTNGSTSATNGSSSKPPKRSKRSSTTTTQTDAIVRTSQLPDGDSNSSQTSA